MVWQRCRPMTRLKVNATSTAQWCELVREAAAGRLDEELESYLVFMLDRFAARPDLAERVLALDYLRGMQASGGERRERLRDVGDQCLLYSGLFPGQARRRRVRVGYMVALGRGAYAALAEAERAASARMFRHLARTFVHLVAVLHSMRAMASGEHPLDALEAFELWADTGSAAAAERLAGFSAALPMVPGGGPWAH